MPIHVEWENESKTIIKQTFDGRWTWEDFNNATAIETHDLIKTVSHTVCIISDFSKAYGIPTGTAFTNVRSVMTSFPDNWGILVIIGGNQFITMMVDMFKKMFKTEVGRKTFTADTIEDAYNIIAEYIDEANEVS